MNPLADLLDSLALAPSLPGAACAGHHDLYDLTIQASTTGVGGAIEVDNARTAALAICERCPVLDACAAWVAALAPKHRPQGVVAGQVITRRTRPRTPKPGRTTAA